MPAGQHKRPATAFVRFGSKLTRPKQQHLGAHPPPPPPPPHKKPTKPTKPDLPKKYVPLPPPPAPKIPLAPFKREKLAGAALPPPPPPPAPHPPRGLPVLPASLPVQPHPAAIPAPFKREIFPGKAVVVKSKLPTAAKLEPEKEEDVTKYLYPPYVAPKHIPQPGDKVRTVRKAPALSPEDFVKHIESNVNAALAAASAPIPVAIPAPPPPKRVGRSHKYPLGPPPPLPVAQEANAGGIAGIFSSIKKRFGFKKRYVTCHIFFFNCNDIRYLILYQFPL